MLAPLLQQLPQLVAETKTMSLSNAAKLTGGADEEVALLFRAAAAALHSSLKNVLPYAGVSSSSLS